MTDPRVFKLVVVVRGAEPVAVYGPREDLKPVLDAWVQGSFTTRFVVSGHCNTADRAEISVAVDPEEVVAMVLIHEF